VPTWARDERPTNGENGGSFAKRICDIKYKGAPYDKGPSSPYNQIKKWGDTHFVRTPLPTPKFQTLPSPTDEWFFYDPSGTTYNKHYWGTI